MQGTYTDSYGKNPKKIDVVGFYNLLTNKFGTAATPFDDKIREFLKATKVYAE